MSALATMLARAYASRGIAATLTPAAGTGPVACVMIVGPVGPAREVAQLLATGDRVAGYELRVRVAELVAKPVEGDVIALGALALRVTLVARAPHGLEWYVTATPTVAPSSSTGVAIGPLMPPLLGGWAWA